MSTKSTTPTIVQPIRILSEEGLWKRVDVRGIDGAVNGVAETVGGLGNLLRRLQTGSVRAYAASLLAGVVLVLGLLPVAIEHHHEDTKDTKNSMPSATRGGGGSANWT